MRKRHERPVIMVSARDLRDITSDAARAIAKANEPNPMVFRFGSSLVRLRTLDQSASLETMNTDLLVNHLADVVAWKAKDKDGKLRPAYPPEKVARNVLAEHDWPVPVIQRVIHAPVFAADGTLIDRYGYNPDAQVFLALNPALAIPPVSLDPTPSEMRTATTLLVGTLLADFPFVDQADRAHAMGAMLMPFVRSMITGPTPLHLINAPTKGTGKTLLAEAVVHPAAGSQACPLKPGMKRSGENGWVLS